MPVLAQYPRPYHAVLPNSRLPDPSARTDWWMTGSWFKNTDCSDPPRRISARWLRGHRPCDAGPSACKGTVPDEVLADDHERDAPQPEDWPAGQEDSAV